MRELNGTMAALSAGAATYSAQTGDAPAWVAFYVGVTVLCALVCLKPKD